ncbi:MAG: dihydroorotate dehydrogenase electron transfer subunit [Lachnospiraceae bacterium]|nr:dihydroorotate dehydrogenase electron transfer subunit [Lachnospiraceae bacterium]
MGEKVKEKAVIISQEEISLDIYSMWIETNAAKTAKPGQFVALYCNDGSRILPRPISICEIDKKNNRLRFVYRVVGKGTDEFSKYHAGTEIEIMGPLGNGFPMEKAKGKKAILIGGGIGVPPMVELAKQLDAESKVIVAGYRNLLFLDYELKACGDFYPATEDGSIGVKGTVIDAIVENKLEADVIYACGPTPMLRAIKEYAEKHNIEAWVSMEEKMACGIGACLACVCKTKEKDKHTNVNNTRICKEGPVFNAEEVEL